MKNIKKFCARPFEAIHLDPGGNVRVCSWTDATIGNVLDESIEEIWKGEKAEKVRQSIIDQSFVFCRSTSCPCLENNELEVLDDSRFTSKCKVSEHPKHVNAAYDFRCNHSCPSCREKLFRPDAEYREKTDKIAVVATELINNAESFSTCGNGDLFASESVMRMLKEIRPCDDCKITLETNGVLFTPENWEKISHLSKYHLTVVITPNSYDKETYKYLSGGHDNLERLINNLKYIKRLRENNEINHVSISIVVQDRNFRELPSFIKRSIDEFGADDVIVKPLYKWFCLSEEDYWFKDVLNPLHPYHADYLEMMKDPIIENPKVYLWGARNLHLAVKHPAYRYKNLLDIIEKYCGVEDVNQKYNRVISNYLHKSDSKRLFLYGDNAISKFFYSQLDRENKGHIVIMARDLRKTADRSIEEFADYKPLKGDVIVVTEEYNIKYIQRDLSLKEFEGDLITINSVFEEL